MIEVTGQGEGMKPRNARGEVVPAALPTHLLSTPLEYLYADHLRQRGVCAVLRRLAAAGHVDEDEAKVLASFLERDMILHHADEEETLFPLLGKRCDHDDRLEADLSRLSLDHRKSRPQLLRIADILLQAGGHISASDASLFANFAAHEFRHLAFESGVILPIARVRLTRKDIATLSRQMRARRGIATP